jgi:hypothetical protein
VRDDDPVPVFRIAKQLLKVHAVLVLPASDLVVDLFPGVEVGDAMVDDHDSPHLDLPPSSGSII